MITPSKGRLASLEHSPANHFRLRFYGAVLLVRERVPEATRRFAFLRDYCDELDASGLGESEAWEAAVRGWEAETPVRLPLRALIEAAALSDGALDLLLSAGLVDEDARFGALFESIQGPGQSRPTAGLIHSWWPASRNVVRTLIDAGLLEIDDDAPGADSSIRVPGVLWDAVHGEKRCRPAPWARLRLKDELVALGDLILPRATLATVGRAPEAIAQGAVHTIVVRGPEAGGRRTLLGAIARASGYGVLELSGLPADDRRWRLVGSLATLLEAMPVAALDVPPGETVALPPLPGWTGPVGLALGRQGGVAGESLDRAVTIVLGLPDEHERRRHWAAALDDGVGTADIAGAFRMTGGNIRRTAELARAEAALQGRREVTERDVLHGARALHGRLLDTLASRVPVDGDWTHLAVPAETMHELQLLESRCRHREHLLNLVGPGFGSELTRGVRALFSGPSGTGKTLAARLLASALRVDLYRLDLATVVNKYLGETEKNLSTVFARAEEADIALLLDEGDALLTARTAVQTSNDRYANLETNYLLQRLETFEGILIVTTNAGERIDDAFLRRMDVVVEFRPPGELERWAIWRLHLPKEHEVDGALLEQLALRCELTGGQIRNAILHASLLTLEDGGVLTTAHLDAAVRREYLKGGAICPLAPQEGLVG